ncbi:N-acetylmuramoyl-L-alanine amidase [Pontimicrobium sp. SW4]|uniref:N-acetylmuramoyl-L-alanine amidase n=1 Tax=Pontimicrobium sp. SW4 TaxID=3153519 RepID=A0AAU7BQP0_9FLAO
MTKIVPFIFFFFIGCHLAFSQTPQKKVIAIKGDGIYSLLRKNGLDPLKHFKEFIILNQKNLGKDNSLFIGKTYSLPEINTIIVDSTVTTQIDSIKLKNSKSKEIIPALEKEEFSIFGEEYASVVIEDKKLEGAIYYLISGHGGPDPGATEIYNKTLISEDEYAYDVTLRLARMLIASGAKVYIIIKDPNDGIRDKRILEVDYDEVSYSNKKIPLSQKLRLKQRTEAVNNLFFKQKSKYQRLIVTHVDSRSKSKNIDVFFYHHKNSKKGKQLAENIHNSFKQKYNEHQPNRVYSGTVSSRSSLYLVKNTLPPMVYIELGNIKSDKDQKRILNYENRQALAKWIYNGIINDFEHFK